MKRKALSSRLVAEKIAFFVLLALVLIFCLKHYPELLFIAAPVLIILDYLIYYWPDKIEFDKDHIFIKRKKGEEAVALEDIYLVKMTGWRIGIKSTWKIKYINYKGKGAARFYPRYFSSTFEDFVKLVKEKNPGVEF